MASTTVITPPTPSNIGPTQSEPTPVTKPVQCRACGDIGWWCRGCGGGEKIAGMSAAGIPAEEADSIYHEQFAGCDKPFVPCYVCNRRGRRSPPDGFAVRRKFWWTEAD